MAGERIKIGGVEIDVRADGTLLLADLKRAENQARAFGDKAGAEMSNGFNKAFGQIKAGLVGIFAGLGVARLANEALQAADAFTGMRSRLSLVVAEGENLLEIEEKLAKQALANRADLNATVSLYARLRTSRKDLDDATTTSILDAWSKTLVISGANATEAASATLQFAQAMGSGRLQGAELTAVLENNSRASRLIADSLGVPIGQLKKLGEEGKLTTDVLVDIFTNAGALDAEFGKMAMTVGQAGTNFNTAFTRVIGLLDQSTGVSAGLAKWIDNLGTALLDLGTALGGPIAEAEAMQQKWSEANAAIAKDIPLLKQKQDELREAINGQGDDAERTAQREVDAITKRIAKNRELAAEYARGSRDKLIQAERELKGIDEFALRQKLLRSPQVDITTGKTVIPYDELGFKNITPGRAGLEEMNRQTEARFGNLDRQIESVNQIINETLLGKGTSGLSNYQVDVGKRIDERRDILNRIESAREGMKILAGGGVLSSGETPPKPAGTGSGGSAEAEKSKLKGYTTALQEYREVIDDIAKSQEKGAVKSSAALKAVIDYNNAHDPDEALLDYNAALRAIAAQELSDSDRHAAETKAMTDYYDALNAVSATMQLIADLSDRGIISDEDAARARDMILAADFRNETPELPVDDAEIQADMQKEWDQAAINLGIDPNAEPEKIPKSYWDEYEFDIMDATKRGLFDAIQEGDYGDLLSNVIGDAASSGLSRAVDQMVDNLFLLLSNFDWSTIFGGADGGLGSSLNSLFDIFAGNKASGGPVRAGRGYRVGELGAEMFVPSTDGYIIPNTQPNASSNSGVRQITIGGTTINIDSMGRGVTPEQLEAVMNEYTRSLGDVIDARVQEGARRGTFG